MDIDIDSEYNHFQVERRKVYNDIGQFLMMTLTYFEDMEKKRHFRPDVIAANLQGLIKSLCLLHALHGYPADPNTGDILIKRSEIMQIYNNYFIITLQECKIKH